METHNRIHKVLLATHAYNKSHILYIYIYGPGKNCTHSSLLPVINTWNPDAIGLGQNHWLQNMMIVKLAGVKPGVAFLSTPPAPLTFNDGPLLINGWTYKTVCFVDFSAMCFSSFLYRSINLWMYTLFIDMNMSMNIDIAIDIAIDMI